jgi:dTDP-4-dehydrorhamnose reductase
MRVLVTGGSGLLGSALLQTASKRDVIRGTRFTKGDMPLVKMDVTDADEVNRTMDIFNPDVVIHCAGEGRVDFAESNPTETRRINVEGTRIVAAATKRFGADFVYISTNAVYDGDKGPYSEGSNRFPVNTYGQIKKEAEDSVDLNAVIIRPIFLFGWPPAGQRGNFVTRVIESLRAGKPVEVSDQIMTQPTYAIDCAEAIWQIIRKTKGPGAFNVSSENTYSLLDFAYQIATVFRLDSALIDNAPSFDSKGFAKRPINATFTRERIKSMGILFRDTMDALKHMKDAE